MFDQRLNGDEPCTKAGQPDKAGERLRDHHQLPHNLSIIFAAHIENEAQALVGNEGKRMRRVQRLRGEHWQDLFAEICAHLRLQGLSHRRWLNDLNAFASQFLHQFAPKLLLLDHQPVGGGNGVGKLFGWRAAINRQLFDLALLLPA